MMKLPSGDWINIDAIVYLGTDNSACIDGCRYARSLSPDDATAIREMFEKEQKALEDW
jgi:hypothetical protein